MGLHKEKDLLDHVFILGVPSCFFPAAVCVDCVEEVEQAATLVQEAVSPDAMTIFGATFDDSLDDEIRVTVIATGFSKENKAEAPQQPAKEEAAQEVKSYLAEGLFEQTMAERTAKARDTEKVFVLESSNEYMDDMVTTWLKNQVDLGKTWARIYGCGFRDVMQDVPRRGS